MSIAYIPAGRPVSTSYAISSSVAFTASWVYPTASIAGFALAPSGSQGVNFIIFPGTAIPK